MSDDTPKLPSGKIDLVAFEKQMRRQWQNEGPEVLEEGIACARRGNEVDIQFLLWWHSEIDNGTSMQIVMDAAVSMFASAARNMTSRIVFESDDAREAFMDRFFQACAATGKEYLTFKPTEDDDDTVVPAHMGNA